MHSLIRLCKILASSINGKVNAKSNIIISLESFSFMLPHNSLMYHQISDFFWQIIETAADESSHLYEYSKNKNWFHFFNYIKVLLSTRDAAESKTVTLSMDNLGLTLILHLFALALTSIAFVILKLCDMIEKIIFCYTT